VALVVFFLMARFFGMVVFFLMARFFGMVVYVRLTRSVYLGFFHRLPFRYNRLGDFHVMARFVVMVVSVRMTRLHRLVVSTALTRFGPMVV
jgi:hypothetical protein